VEWVLPSVDGIRTVQRDLIEKYGGSHGVRDEGLLASAVMRGANELNFNPDADAASIGASISFGLIKNHAFIDGNKRIGLAALVDFLGMNGYLLTAPVEEQIDVVQQVAANGVSESAWLSWVVHHIQRSYF
jgi:death-on-curing protein